MTQKSTLGQLNRQIVACERCLRLRKHCRKVAQQKRASYRDQTYHGKPVANFIPTCDPHHARLLVVGLAPGAHGANRTGRMFTGDRSGDFLFRAMHEAGFCNQPTATDLRDGLELHDAAITAAGHCAPPGNKPTSEELANCAPFFDQTFDLLTRLRVVVCLGKIAMDATLKLYKRHGWIDKLSPYKFAHAAEHPIHNAPLILCSYHPSQQNTFTGRLTPDMLAAVFHRARQAIES